MRNEQKLLIEKKYTRNAARKYFLDKLQINPFGGLAKSLYSQTKRSTKNLRLCQP